MYSSEVGGCFGELGFLKECTVFILHDVKLLHFQGLADKHNQIRIQMWISQVFKWWSQCVLSFRTALSWPVSAHPLSGFDQVNSTCHHPANQTTLRWMAARCHLKLFKRPEQVPASMCEPVWYIDDSRGSWKCSEALLAIVRICFPVQLTCREESSQRIWLPTPPSVLTDAYEEVWSHIWF